MNTEQWGIFELTLEGPENGNPFKDIQLFATFKKGNISKKVDGFYDGDGNYKVRFMPNKKGTWTYITKSNSKELSNHKGSFKCIAPSKDNHGPVRVRNQIHFAYEDGTPFYHIGTTGYGWIHAGDKHANKMLKALKTSPFNKVRMLALNWGEMKESFFMIDPKTKKETNRFNPKYFQNLEMRVGQLQELGIEADIILFLYLPLKKGEYALKYFMSRIACFRNVWWCMANEYDFIKSIKMKQWDAMFKIVRKYDPYNHLRAIHNGENDRFYDHNKPWVTHLAVQYQNFLPPVYEWIKKYKKPVALDEIGYEGDCGLFWGYLSGKEMVERCWTGYTQGGYPGHGDNFVKSRGASAKNRKLWVGESISRLAFMKKIMDQGPESGIDPINIGWNNYNCAGIKNEYYIYYFGRSQPAVRHVKLPNKYKYKIDIIDTWNMTITPGKLTKGSIKGYQKIKLPTKPYTAIRIRRT